MAGRRDSARSDYAYSLATTVLLALTAVVCVTLALVAVPYLNGEASVRAVPPTPTLIQVAGNMPDIAAPTPDATWTPVELAAPVVPATTTVPTNAPLDREVPVETEAATEIPPPTDTATATVLPTNTAQPTPTSTDAPPTATSVATVEPPPASGERPAVSLDVDLAYSEDVMTVEQAVVVPNTSQDTWTEVVFSVIPAQEEGVFELGEVTSQGVGVEVEMDGIMLHVPLPEPVAPGDAARIELGYRINFLTVPISTTFPRGMTGRTREVVRAGWWYPALVPYDDGAGWRMWEFHNVGDPITYPAADYMMTITAEPGVTVAGSGPISHEGDVWTFAVEAGRGMAFSASDAYMLTEGEASGIPIYSYHFATDAEAGQATVDVAAEAIERFEALFGPYPYDSLTIVRGRSNSDMEYTALISLSEEVYNEYWGTPQTALYILVAHELSHEWWYGAVGNDQVNEPWLDESLASYGEVLFYEGNYPDVAAQRLAVYENRATSGMLDKSIYDFARTSSYLRELYSRGVVFQNELREQMGDEDYFAFLRAYREAYAGQLATTGDFLSMAQDHTDADLGPLFERYFSE